uniref:Si:dkey-28n18.9 n=1 Tax=Pundamilia nyererei TaxID=303518 RepID=A0A3B4GXY5_9CICH
EEVKETASVLSVHDDSIKVTEVLKEGDTLTFIIVSQKLSGTGEYHVDRTYEDFEWLQQHLFSQGDVPGIQGVIFPPLPAKPQVNASPRSIKQLGFLALGECQPYCKALETFLQQVAAHSILSKNKAVEVFLTSSDPPGRQKVKKNIFNRLSQAVEEMRKEGHKDVDEFFQNERDHNLILTGCTKTAAEVRRSPIASRSHHKQQCTCALPHRVFVCGQKNMTSVAENNVNTLGLGLDLESRYQEAEREMLFRRTCKLVELENAQRNVEKAKPVKKAMEEVKKAAETEFEHTSGVAKQEVKSTINNCIPHFHVSFHSGLVC